jgi:hydroxymethylbilane synthase
MNKVIRIGTRESQLAVWQATQVQNLLTQLGFAAELVYIKSEGDIDLKTPLYEMGVQGIFTRSLDIALLNERIDIAVHSMKDVPTQLPKGIVTAAVLKRASYKDLLVYKNDAEVGNWQLAIANAQNSGSPLATSHLPLTIATSSIRTTLLKTCAVM